jgi:hypothetical protein
MASLQVAAPGKDCTGPCPSHLVKPGLRRPHCALTLSCERNRVPGIQQEPRPSPPGPEVRPVTCRHLEPGLWLHQLAGKAAAVARIDHTPVMAARAHRTLARRCHQRLCTADAQRSAQQSCWRKRMDCSRTTPRGRELGGVQSKQSPSMAKHAARQSAACHASHPPRCTGFQPPAPLKRLSPFHSACPAYQLPSGSPSGLAQPVKDTLRPPGYRYAHAGTQLQLLYVVLPAALLFSGDAAGAGPQVSTAGEVVRLAHVAAFTTHLRSGPG